MKRLGNALATSSSVFAVFATFVLACGGGPGLKVLPPLTGVVAVSVGEGHACAAIDDGTVRCWGSGFGEPGKDGTERLSSRPVTVTGLADISAIEAGDHYTCARGSAGGVSCWGANLWGETANGAQTMEERVPASVMGLSGPVSALSTGEGHTPCARLVNGTVECWGKNTFGLVDRQLTSFPPTAVPGLANVRAVAANGNYACVLSEGGTVSCWGFGPIGQPGGNAAIADLPVAVPELRDCVEISLGESHACARGVDGSVKCWGWVPGLNGRNALNSVTPVAVDALGGAIAIASAGSSTCAVRNDGTVRCVGALDLLAPAPREGAVPGVADAVSISVGPSSACAVIGDGTIRCWGDGNRGQLGDGRIRFFTGAPPAQAGVTVVAEEAPTAARAP